MRGINILQSLMRRQHINAVYPCSGKTSKNGDTQTMHTLCTTHAYPFADFTYI